MEGTRTISVRMPTSIYNQLRRIARKERRSFGKQIVLYVEQQMRADGKFPENEHFLDQENSENQENEGEWDAEYIADFEAAMDDSAQEEIEEE